MNQNNVEIVLLNPSILKVTRIRIFAIFDPEREKVRLLQSKAVLISGETRCVEINTRFKLKWFITKRE